MEPRTRSESMSNFSSIADVPDHLEGQYAPLGEVFQSHGVTLPQKATPESNSGAMIKALKALQEKIRSLEHERAAAAEKLRHLSEEAQKHATSTQGYAVATPLAPSQRPASPQPRTTLSQEQEDLKGRLHSLDARLGMQSKELDQMRERLRQAEADRNEAILRTKRLEEQQQQQGEKKGEEAGRHCWATPHLSRRSTEHDHVTEDFQSEILCNKETEEKVRQLEQAHIRLSAQHSITESRMKELESQLAQRQWQRQHLKFRGTELPSELPPSIEGETTKVKTSMHKTKATSKVPARCTCDAQLSACSSYCTSRPLPDVHYHASLKDIPFVVGTSTSPSHSVGANCQCILATMKRHNTLLCGTAAAIAAHNKKKRSVAIAHSCELLAALEEELGRLAFEHQELSRQLQEEEEEERNEENRGHPRTTSDLEEQLKLVTQQMEIKAEQIRAVQQAQPHVRHGRPCRSAVAGSKGGKKKGHSSGSSLNAELLRGMKAVQSTLQRDDLSWN